MLFLCGTSAAGIRCYTNNNNDMRELPQNKSVTIDCPSTHQVLCCAACACLRAGSASMRVSLCPACRGQVGVRLAAATNPILPASLVQNTLGACRAMSAREQCGLVKYLVAPPYFNKGCGLNGTE